MLKPNVGKTDRIVRVVAGLILLSFVFTVEGGVRWLGLAGLPLLLSGVFGYCFLYSLCKCSTTGGCCGGAKKEGGECCSPKKDEAVEKPAGHCGCGHQH